MSFLTPILPKNLHSPHAGFARGESFSRFFCRSSAHGFCKASSTCPVFKLGQLEANCGIVQRKPEPPTHDRFFCRSFAEAPRQSQSSSRTASASREDEVCR